ncbi:SDR family oxidoreductase [Halalkalicoccus ordinarius]|uniref:SDR family oxidoreductase n=1 Tax=Halalkalicoccus ordinarius TaxID=3116651 RepID=UPI00300E9454
MANEIQPAELDRESILTLEDPRFSSDRVAIVTGAGSGIGRATALALVHNGLTVVATDVDGEGLEETEERKEELGLRGEIETVEADLTDDADVAAIVEAAAGLGEVTYLANIAGFQHVAPLEEFPVETYDAMQRVMVRAPMLLAKHCLPHMRGGEEPAGVVANMCSIHGHYVTRDKVGYNTAKFALRGLTQSIAAEGEGDVRSFSLSTSYVKTPLVVNQIADTAQQRDISEREVVEKVMLEEARTKELMDPIEAANAFVFGFSEHARFLNGADLLFDGGYTLTY